MKPEDVPADLYDLALDALPGEPDEVISATTQEEVRAALAAVIPEIEKRVREQVAAESAVLRPDDLAELLDYVIGDGDVRVVQNETIDRAFAALKATLPPEESR